MTENKIVFTKPPMVGETLTFGGQMITVARVCPYTRRNGSPSYLLEWRHQDGRVGVSGLVARDTRWGQTIDEALRLSVEARARRAAQPDADVPAKRQAPPKARLGIRIDAELAALVREQGDITAFVTSAIKDALERQAAATA